MFITDNRSLFHWWWKENLVKHQKVSKYYENDFSYGLENSSFVIFLFLFKVPKTVRYRFTRITHRCIYWGLEALTLSLLGMSRCSF